jgi:diaminopimelate decarboxylase
MLTKGNRLYFGEYSAEELVGRYGSPLFVYEEATIRERCKELKSFVKNSNFRVNYSCKANNSIAILKIMREEGMTVDAMSPGEIYLELEAGFTNDEILFICNNVSKEEMRFAVEKGILMSVDSLSQLKYYGEINPGGEVFVRINPGIGDGHHAKVTTGGKSKFGVVIDEIPTIKEIAEKYNLKIVGINMHIGSLFLDPGKYLSAVNRLLEVSMNFDDLKFIDFGGGFGIPYKKKEEKRFPVEQFAKDFDQLLTEWKTQNNKANITFIIEPGRYPVAESCTILTTVHSIKENYQVKYIGTDMGMNLLIRPAMYGSYHEVVVCNNVESDNIATVTVCGNICESGDLIAEGRKLPQINLNDTLAVLDAGAYGYAMSSNYNARLRPAEIMIDIDGKARVIREKENMDWLLANQKY